MARGPFEPGALLQDERPAGVRAYAVLSTMASDVMLLTDHLGIISVTERQLTQQPCVYHMLIAPAAAA